MEKRSKNKHKMGEQKVVDFEGLEHMGKDLSDPKIDIALSSDCPLTSSVYKSLEGMGFYISPDKPSVVGCNGMAGNITLLRSPKRVPHHLSVSITKDKYIPTKHGLSNFIIKHAGDAARELKFIIRNHATDMLENMICKEKVENGLIKITKKIDPNVLSEKLVSRILVEAVDEYLKSCDVANSQDLKHQVAFYLSTMTAEELFENCAKFKINASGEFTGEKPLVNRDAIEVAIRAQAKVVDHYVKSAPQEVSRLLSRDGAFSGDRGVLIKRGNSIYCQLDFGLIPVKLKRVPMEYAKDVHERLHYIHAGRGELAFGLFLEGDQLPFSILAVDRIDRHYKKEALILAGYNPSACFEYARLFSRPGSPMNTSSLIQTAVRDKLKEMYPYLQAIITAFMPAYASGKSMISSGFNSCLFSKGLSHKFCNEDGLLAHRVKRRQFGEPVRKSVLQLFPTLYLICKLRQPHTNFWTLPPDYMPHYQNPSR